MNAAQSAQNAAARKRAALANLKGTARAAQARANELYQEKHYQKQAAALNEQERTVTAGHPLDLFPTPPELAARMVALADVRTGQAVLEPSAGTGRIAQALNDSGREIVLYCVELNWRAAELLKARGFYVECADFLEWTPPDMFNRVLMNPPFSNGQDIAHVRRAYDLLAPDGRIVAIMGESAFFRQDRTASEFRAWLDEHGGTSEKLPEGTFKASGTGVAARLVVIDK